MSHSLTCHICEKTLSSKYNLAQHLRCVHGEVTEENSSQELCCTSERCDYKTHYRGDQKRHVQRCPHVLIDHEVQKEREKLVKYYEDLMDLERNKIISEEKLVLAEKQAEIDRLKSELQQSHLELKYVQGQLEVMRSVHDHDKQVIAHAMDKPTIVQNNSQNFHVTNMLANHDVYMQQTDYNHIVEMARQFFEPYFWDGQRGAARFAVEHIIIIGDSWILCCSDPTRNRFRFRTRDNKLQDDIKAKLFIEKLSKPLKFVCHDLFQAIVKDLETKKKLVTNVWEKGDLELKIGMAENRYFLICDMDNDDKNAEFRSELASRLRGPELAIENKSDDNMST
jgi:hypothetical protein